MDCLSFELLQKEALLALDVGMSIRRLVLALTIVAVELKGFQEAQVQQYISAAISV